jgi:TonB family protein
MSLFFNILLFSLLAGLTVKRDRFDQVMYYPVKTILLPSEVKQPLPSKKITPVPEQPKPEKQRPPVIPKPEERSVVGLDKEPDDIQQDETEQTPVTDIDTSLPQQAEQQTEPQTEYQPYFKVSRLPSFKVKVMPVYPPSERAAGSEARVVAQVFINRFGGIDNIEIIKSAGHLFDNAVIQAIKDSTFAPGYKDNEPVPVKVQIPYVFRLR